MTNLEKTEDDQVILSYDRVLVCLEVAWELDALARVLPGLVPNVGEAHGAYHAVRGIAGRFLRLSSVLMSGLGDEAVPTSELERVVHLQEGQG